MEESLNHQENNDFWLSPMVVKFAEDQVEFLDRSLRRAKENSFRMRIQFHRDDELSEESLRIVRAFHSVRKYSDHRYFQTKYNKYQPSFFRSTRELFTLLYRKRKEWLYCAGKKSSTNVDIFIWTEHFFLRRRDENMSLHIEHRFSLSLVESLNFFEGWNSRLIGSSNTIEFVSTQIHWPLSHSLRACVIISPYPSHLNHVNNSSRCTINHPSQ